MSACRLRPKIVLVKSYFCQLHIYDTSGESEDLVK